MEHSFDVEVAKELGINCAILLKNIYFWVEKNKANNKHFYEDQYWTYNSTKAFNELFPYMTERGIAYALSKLEESGYIITGNYNKSAYDRTKWYAVTKKGYSILQNCKMDTTKLSNGFTKNVEPIPDIKQDSKTNIESVEQSSTIPYEDIISYLNTKAGTSFRSSSKDNQKWIKARWNEGYTLVDFKKVIDTKVKEWKSDTKMAQYLRPSTLFSPKFEAYLNQQVKADNVKSIPADPEDIARDANGNPITF